MFEFEVIPRLVVGLITAAIGLPIVLWLQRDLQQRRPDAPSYAIAVAVFVAGGIGTLAAAGMVLIPLELILRLFL